LADDDVDSIRLAIHQIAALSKTHTDRVVEYGWQQEDATRFQKKINQTGLISGRQ
jgi:gamma-glutamyl phosphate reductase